MKGEKTDKELFSVIRYEGNNTVFAYKYPKEDFSMGSQLIVHETQEAIFFKDGKALDLFGPGKYTLETSNIPLVSKAYNKPLFSDSVFHSEIYFVNMTTHMAIKWGTDSKINIFDPNTGIPLQLGACGEFSIRVTNSRMFLLKLVGTTGGMTTDDLFAMNASTAYFKNLILTKIKSYIGSIIKESQLNILELDSQLECLSDAMRIKLLPILDEYGMDMPQFVITRILLPEEDPNFRRMKQQYADKYLIVQEEKIKKLEAESAKERKEIEAETAAKLKIIGVQGNAEALKIQKQAEAEAYKMKAEAEATEMQMKGYTYQQETSRMVGMEAMKNGMGGAGGAVSSIGDIVNLGVGLGAMGGVMNITKDAMNPMTGYTSEMEMNMGNIMNVPWDCKCGRKNVRSKFCPDCGSHRPEKDTCSAWDCKCGRKNITSKFCPDCGAEKSIGWNCECGMKNITSRFCPNCGKENKRQ